MTTRQNKKKGSSKFRLFLKVTMLLTLSLAICATAYGVYLTKQAEHAADSAYEVIEDRKMSDQREVKVEPAQDNVSILILGVDDSDKRGQGADNSRTDALLLATLNNKTKTVKLVSIPRDSYVYIPHIGYNDKINHAHARGGTLASIETVEELFDIPIDYYMRVNFNAFIDIVDALGGIEAEVPYAMLEKDEFDRNTVNLQPGLQTLDGREALALARTRKQDNDIERGKRQQEIIQAIASKAASFTSLSKYDDILSAVGNNMKTDMTFTEMKSFFSYLSNGMPRIDTLTLEGYDDMSTGVYYYKLDEEALAETSHILKSHLGLTPESTNISGTSSQSNSAYTTKTNSDTQ
ncbi:LCP family protein required for cell wall assembly [Solibacillus kalamii]|uniref:Transcriptional regulator n=1 Tax=Solibacillus kalamii TaxID=1748298 RepID=A0ABX3ZLZ7_9BACL|nr:LCP family protein [Solibacillus kalamii]MBM7664850.1 LCP family protein required for cell wall assembly [Solibacillus kalamii]OUZ40776.1 transcriptional regulator [Solibacillus kalamii]